MSNYTFRPAVKEQVALLIGCIGPSGGGKTMSAMRMAQGIVGRDKSFAIIDTEQGRACHYAPNPGQEPDFISTFRFDHCDLHAPFRPEAYMEAILAADAAGYKAIIVDSMSHEWASEGGILDWQEEELTRMAGDDYKKREACKMAAWIKPKMSHKQMVQRLLQVKAHLILCFRAEEKVKMERDSNNKTVIVPQGWQPICEKNLPYELTVSILLTPDKPGFPKPLKLQEQHKTLSPLNKELNEESGKLIAEWAAGGKVKPDSTEITETSNEDPRGRIGTVLDMILAVQSVDALKETWTDIGKMEWTPAITAQESLTITKAKNERKAELDKK